MNKNNFKLPKSKFKRSSYELAIEEGKIMSDQNKSYTEIREILDEKYPSEQFYMQDIMASILQYAIKNKIKDKNMFKKMTDGGWVLVDADTEIKLGEYETESEARKMMYEYEGNSNIMEKSFFDKLPPSPNRHSPAYNFADGGGVPNTENSFNLPLEMAVYVPSTINVNEVISIDEMNERENQVKTFLAERFGGYTMSDKVGGYVDNSGNIVNEEITQVVSFATLEAWEKHKNELVAKISEWADKWGQEAIGLEFEGDMFYIEKEPAMVMKSGGQLWIQNAVDKMKQKGTIGAFKKQAKREGISTTEFAKKVLENPKKYTLKTKRRAIFFKNTNPKKF